MTRLIVDLDETVTLHARDGYADAEPNMQVIIKLREFKARGFEIVINTSRNMRTYGGNVGLINVHTLPVILQWLERHAVPYDEVHVGKPWCGTDGFYVDDRAIRPSEFVRCSLDEIRALLLAEKAGR